MAILYSKGGEKVVVPHAIDVREWLKEGYTLTPADVAALEEANPPEQPETIPGDAVVSEGATPPLAPVEPVADPEQPETDAEWFESVKGKLGTLGAEDVQRAAKIAGVEYTNKRDTVAAIKDKIQ